MNKTLCGILICLGFLSVAEAQMYDPFRKTAKSVQKPGLLPPPPMMISRPAPPPPAVVTAVMNDKAFINGAWYRVGDRVNHQEIAYIRNDFVGLKEGNRLTMIGVGTTRRVLGTKDIQ